MRLRGPRLFAGERIARRHGIEFSLRQPRAVALVFQNFGLAPLVKLKRAIRQPIVTNTRGVSIVARAIGAVVPSSAAP